MLHCANLNRGGLRAEQNVVCDIEGVLRIACGVILGNVQRLEIVVVQLHLRPFDNRKAHADEDVLQFALYLGQRVNVTVRLRGSGHGNVQFFGFQFLFECARLRVANPFCNRFFNARADFVCQLSDLRALFCGKRTHTAQNGSQFAFLSEIANLDLFGICVICVDLCQSRFPDLCKFFFHFSVSFLSQQKRPAPKNFFYRTGRNQQSRGTTRISAQSQHFVDDNGACRIGLQTADTKRCSSDLLRSEMRVRAYMPLSALATLS